MGSPKSSPNKKRLRGNDYSSINERVNEMEKELKLKRGEENDMKGMLEIFGERLARLEQNDKAKDKRIEELLEVIKIKDEEISKLTEKATNPDTNTKSNEEIQQEIIATKSTLETMVEENRQIKDQITETTATMTEKLGNTVRKDEFANQLANHARNVGEYANIDREIMAFRVEEKEEKNFNERMKKEREMVTHILKEIDETWDGQGLIEHRRIGKYTPEGNGRPLKITLLNSQMAANFVQQAKKLKDHTQLKEVGIRKCLSKTERDTLREAVNDMKTRNGERSVEEQDLFFWSIRNMKATKIWKRTVTILEEKQQTSTCQ